MNPKIKNSVCKNQSQNARPSVVFSVLAISVITVFASIFLSESLEKKKSPAIASINQNDLVSTGGQKEKRAKETKKNANIRLKFTQEVPAGAEPTPLTIASYGVEKIIAEVMQALDNPDEDVRQTAMEKLGGMRTASLNAPLQKALRDASPEVRELAMEVMGEIRSSEIIPSLESALSIGDEAMREIALEILEDIEDPRSVDILIESGLKDKSEVIREAALNSLEYMTEMVFKSYEDAKRWWSSNRDSFKF